MSIQIMNAVWQHSKATGRARLVLLAIADHQGEIGAWPSRATLAKMVNSSERSVQRDIQELISLGELRVEIQNAPSRTQYKSNLYWVTLPGVTDWDAGVTDETSGVTDSASGVTAGGSLTLNRNLKETLTEPFNEFWNEYPKKEDKGLARKSYANALKKATAEEILQGAKAYALLKADTEKRYIKNPSTWLNAEAWNNQVAEPEQKKRKYRF